MKDTTPPAFAAPFVPAQPTARSLSRTHRTTAFSQRLLVHWDPETGWAHLAVAEPGGANPRFAGFHRFPSGDTDSVLAALTEAGWDAGQPTELEDGMLGVRARPGREREGR
ncbi:hypothetical protein [Amycolatopsis sp. CA-230715]|uniref:hypothetical protein n=1 Tax=Amycolatopsis sp. CA-230715 TaxID=2745196 RepID=UPI001C01A471|nr:hypothetical protein [Amycolatopsis sp. CA-230715]QWF76685.1 hypothetical protein HUW46_00061 [Amycolatopsis sp. CA-230715]